MSNAWAHAGHADSWWSVDPWVWAGFALLLLVRPRRGWCFALAVCALFAALVYPFDVLAQASLAAHMTQHMLLIGVAAPLMALARPSLPLLKGSRAFGLLLRTPALVAFALHAAAIWAGHAPAVIAWTLAHRWVHILEHVALLGSGLLFWWSLRQLGRAGAGAAALWSFATLVHTGVLGALLTLAPRALYPPHSLEDQQLAGLLMWVPGALPYLAAGLAFTAAWLSPSPVACNRS